MRLTRDSAVLVAALYLCLTACATARAASGALVSDGKPDAVIVTGEGEFDRFVAGELQRYFQSFSGAKLDVVSPGQARERARSLAWVLVGGPQANPLVQEAASKKLVNFEGLKAGGVVLR